VLLAWWGTQGLTAWLADYLPRKSIPSASMPPVLGFAVLLAVVAGLGFGPCPRLVGQPGRPARNPQEGNHQSSPAGHRWRQGLVALEVALALVLAVNTGLLVKSIYQLYATELGYRTSDVLTANLALPRPLRHAGAATRIRHALARVAGRLAGRQARVPHRRPAALGLPAGAVTSTLQGSTANANASANSAPKSMAVVSATPDFFPATGIALRQGRYSPRRTGPTRRWWCSSTNRS